MLSFVNDELISVQSRDQFIVDKVLHCDYGCWYVV